MASRLLIEEPPLLVLPRLAKLVGINEAIVLQQVHYWINPQINKNYFHNRHWVWKTYKQWSKEFNFWAEKTIRRTIDNLETQKLLLSFKQAKNLKTVKYYTIDYDRLNTLIYDFLPSCNEEPSDSQITPASLKEGSSLEEGREDSRNFPENQGARRDGQNDHLELPISANVMNQDFDADIIPLCKNSEDDFMTNESSSLFTINEYLSQSPRDGQNDQVDMVKMTNTDQEATFLTNNSQKIEEDQGARRDGQNDHFELPISANVMNKGFDENIIPISKASLGGQNDQVEMVKMTNTYNKDKTTLKKITLLPQKSEEEKEDQNISFDKLIDEALVIWNRLVQKDRTPVRLTSPRKQKLIHLLNAHFANNLNAWEAYCHKISDNEFLMGKGENKWRVNFDWGVEETNCVKVLEEYYYSKSPILSSNPISSPNSDLSSFQSELAQHCRGITEDPTWFQIAWELTKKIGVNTFKSWFLKVTSVAFQTSSLTIIFPTPFLKDYVKQNFERDLFKIAHLVNSNIETVLIQTKEESNG